MDSEINTTFIDSYRCVDWSHLLRQLLLTGDFQNPYEEMSIMQRYMAQEGFFSQVNKTREVLLISGSLIESLIVVSLSKRKSFQRRNSFVWNKKRWSVRVSSSYLTGPHLSLNKQRSERKHHEERDRLAYCCLSLWRWVSRNTADCSPNSDVFRVSRLLSPMFSSCNSDPHGLIS